MLCALWDYLFGTQGDLMDPPKEPFQDTLVTEEIEDRFPATLVIRVGDYATCLDLEDGKLTDFQMEWWWDAPEEPGGTPTRFGCQVLAGDDECLEDPDEMYQAIIRYWMTVAVKALSEEKKR